MLKCSIHCRLYVICDLNFHFLYAIDLSWIEGKTGLIHYILFLILPMALTASKVSTSPVANKMTTLPKSHGISFAKSIQQNKLHFSSQGGEARQLSYGCLSRGKKTFLNDVLWYTCQKSISFTAFRGSSVLCMSTGTQDTETKECHYGDCTDITR